MVTYHRSRSVLVTDASFYAAGRRYTVADLRRGATGAAVFIVSVALAAATHAMARNVTLIDDSSGRLFTSHFRWFNAPTLPGDVVWAWCLPGAVAV